MKLDDYTPEQAMREQLELMTKAGRRCAYDLRHAADLMSGDAEFQQMMYSRASHWLTVFNPGDDGKNYRHRLHHTIMKLEDEVARLKKLCEDHNISSLDINSDIPF